MKFTQSGVFRAPAVADDTPDNHPKKVVLRLVYRLLLALDVACSFPPCQGHRKTWRCARDSPC